MNFLAVYMREMALLQKKMGKLGYIFSAVMFPIIYLFAFGMGIGPVMNNIHGGYLLFGKGNVIYNSHDECFSTDIIISECGEILF